MYPDQHIRARRLVEGCLWGDIDKGLWDFERALWLLLDATFHDVAHWDEEQERLELGDEFSQSHEAVEAFPEGLHRAYVARLVYSAALRYGLFDRVSLEDGTEADSAAAVIRGLNDITTIRLQDEVCHGDAPSS
jgi:hypothetical protein